MKNPCYNVVVDDRDEFQFENSWAKSLGILAFKKYSDSIKKPALA